MNGLEVLKLLRKIIKFPFLHIRKWFILNHVASHKGELFVGPGKVKLSKNTFLNKNPNFNGIQIKGLGKVMIGDNFHSGPNCLIITTYHNYQGDKIPYDETVVNKDVCIKDNVWIGERVIILGGITIEEGAIIQAGAVVVSNIPYCAIAGGNPAKVFKYRDIERYEYHKLNNRTL